VARRTFDDDELGVRASGAAAAGDLLLINSSEMGESGGFTGLTGWNIRSGEVSIHPMSLLHLSGDGSTALIASTGPSRETFRMSVARPALALEPTTIGCSRFGIDWRLSPDGRTLAGVDTGHASSSLFTISVEELGKGAAPTVLTRLGSTDVATVQWSAAGGLYLLSRTDAPRTNELVQCSTDRGTCRRAVLPQGLTALWAGAGPRDP
jgi:hypothetical protein